jgi:hypothetical protein
MYVYLTVRNSFLSSYHFLFSYLTHTIQLRTARMNRHACILRLRYNQFVPSTVAHKDGYKHQDYSRTCWHCSTDYRSWKAIVTWDKFVRVFCWLTDRRASGGIFSARGINQDKSVVAFTTTRFRITPFLFAMRATHFSAVGSKEPGCTHCIWNKKCFIKDSTQTWVYSSLFKTIVTDLPGNAFP